MSPLWKTNPPPRKPFSPALILFIPRDHEVDPPRLDLAVRADGGHGQGGDGGDGVGHRDEEEGLQQTGLRFNCAKKT